MWLNGYDLIETMLASSSKSDGVIPNILYSHHHLLGILPALAHRKRTQRGGNLTEIGGFEFSSLPRRVAKGEELCTRK